MSKNNNVDTLENLLSSKAIKPFEKFSDAPVGLYNIDKYALDSSFENFDKWHKDKVEAFRTAGKTEGEKKELEKVGVAFSQSVNVIEDFHKKVDHKLNGASEKINKVAQSIQTGLKDFFSHVSNWLSGKTKKKEMLQEIEKTTKELIRSAGLTNQEKNIIKARYTLEAPTPKINNMTKSSIPITTKNERHNNVPSR